MRVLVTGGAGFVGSHLCEALLCSGHEVVALDNFITGRRQNIAHLEREPSFTMLEGDVCEPPDLGVEAIFHLASPASPTKYERYPVETLRANAEGSYRLLELARARGAHFLLASTSEVYGDPLEHPQREDYAGNVDPVGPRSCYDEGKRYAEALTTTYVRHHRVNARIVRIFNCYGPRSDPEDGRVIPQFAVQALRGEPITVHRPGTQTRSLCYVSDLVEGLMRAMSASLASTMTMGESDFASRFTISANSITECSSGLPRLKTRPAVEGTDIARISPSTRSDT